MKLCLRKLKQWPVGELGILLIIFSISRWIFSAVGVRFRPFFTGYPAWQALDVELLRDDLLTSLFYLHAQPPLFNLFAGLTLKIFTAPDEAVRIVFLLLGLIQVAAIWLLLRRLSVRTWLRYCLAILYIASPAAVLYENYYFYTYPVATILLVSSFCLLRYLEKGRIAWGLAFFFLGAALVLTRSPFHLVWLAMAALIALTGAPGRARRTLLLLAVPLALCLGWYGKNYLLFGSFTSSTWKGWSLSHIATGFLDAGERDAMIREGKISPLAALPTFAEPAFYRGVYPPDRPVPDYYSHPALNREEKTGGGVNYNHHEFIAVASRFGRDALAVMAARPGAYLRGVSNSFRLYHLPTGSYHFLSPNRRRIEVYARAWEFLGGSLVSPGDPDYYRQESGRTTRAVSWGSVLAFCLLPLIVLSRRIRENRPVFFVSLYIVFNIVFVTAVSILSDYGDNQRYRFQIIPLMVVALGVLLEIAFTLRKSRRVQSPGS